MESNESEKLKRDKFYPLADRLAFGEHKKIGLLNSAGLWITGLSVHAVWDGQPPRCPKKGEWYLSGSIIEAYRAPNDLSTPYHIARLVKTKKETKTVITAI
jgi:hypothetical protein